MEQHPGRDHSPRLAVGTGGGHANLAGFRIPQTAFPAGHDRVLGRRLLGSAPDLHRHEKRHWSPLLSASISHAYTLSFWLHSDPLFALLCVAAILVAFQINERRGGLWWRLPLLLLLCAMTVLVRWLGVANWVLVAGALLQGQNLLAMWQRPDRRWVAMLLAGVITAGTFFCRAV